jgi:hypothetical protein
MRLNAHRKDRKPDSSQGVATADSDEEKHCQFIHEHCARSARWDRTEYAWVRPLNATGSDGASMVEVFYETGNRTEQMNEQTAYVTLALVRLPPASFLVVQVERRWHPESSQMRREVTLWSCQDYEGDAIREYDQRRAAIQGTGFAYVVAEGELRLVPPVTITAKITRRGTPVTWPKSTHKLNSIR